VVSIFITKRFVSGTLRGLEHEDRISGFPTAEDAANWVKVHRTKPVRPNPAGGSSAYVVADASFQKYWRD